MSRAESRREPARRRTLERSVRVAFAFAVGAALAACRDEPARTSVVLITLDTTRADALGCYGATPDVTPALNALAREGVLYENARTVTPTTLPAHASMLTGLYPNRHGVRDNSLSALPSAARTIAEFAAAEGCATAAFVSARVLDRAFGLDQGFEVYSQPAREGDVVDSESFGTRPGSRTVAEACAWLAELPPERPYFLWVHLFDPHQPWTSDHTALARANGNPYLADVALADAAVGALMHALRTSGRLAHTAIVVVGDHGEGLGEHGEDTHALFVYDSTLRVPFLVRYPDGARAAERSDEVVSVADVFPTICEALAVKSPHDADGESLWRRRIGPERGVYFESYYSYLHHGLAPLAGWADARGKYIHTSLPEYYAAAQTPAEQRNSIAHHVDEASNGRRHIEAVAGASPLPKDARLALPRDAKHELHELGYASAAGVVGELPHPLAPSERASPHASADDLRRCEAAERALHAGQYADAAALLSDVLTRQAANAFAWELLGHCQLRLEREPAARASFERALQLGPDRASLRKALGYVLDRAGDREGARRAYVRAWELDPTDVESLRFLHQAALRRGDDAESTRWLERLKAAQL